LLNGDISIEGIGTREAILLPLRYLPLWLAGIQTKRVRPEIRQKLLLYQEECAEVLFRYFLGDGVVSGGKPMHSRVGGQRILDLVQRSAVAHVVTYKLDRLFRDCADCLTVTAAWDKKAIALHLVDLGGQTLDTSSAMGRFFLTVMAGAAELERNLIRERTSEAMGYVKSQGRKTGGDVPYGYAVTAGGRLVADEAEQALLDAIRSARSRGLSQRQIVAELAARGFTTRKGTALGLTQVQRIMQQAQIA
jgi:site-specific DNA recombinase